MAVWTLLVERNRHQTTNFAKPWESPQGFETHVMYGPPDSEAAWKQAKRFLASSLECAEPDYRLIGLMKGDFATNFYSYYVVEGLENEDE